MSSQPWVSGQSYVYLGLGSQGAPLFFGCTINGPQHATRNAWIPYMADISGPVIPLDKMWAGRKAAIAVDMAIYNMDLLDRLEATPHSATVAPNNGVAGVERADARGTMLMHEGLYFNLYLTHPFKTSHPAFAGLPRFYRYIANFVDQIQLQPGIRPYYARIVLEALPFIDYATGTFTLYDKVGTGITMPAPDFATIPLGA